MSDTGQERGGAKPEQLELFAWTSAREAPPSSGLDVDEPALLRRLDPGCNMRRFYGLTLARSLFGEWGVVRRWGRIGAQGRVRTDWHGTREAGEVELARMAKAKRRRGYR